MQEFFLIENSINTINIKSLPPFGHSGGGIYSGLVVVNLVVGTVRVVVGLVRGGLGVVVAISHPGLLAPLVQQYLPFPPKYINLI